MKRNVVTLSLALATVVLSAQTWRSSLYPKDWKPGYSDKEGRNIQDFSYAGYHAGEKEIPYLNDNVLDVTASPYFADNTGKTDVTAIIQKALDDAGRAKGGVVYLPKGEYRVSVAPEKNYALILKYNNVVLRGAGQGKTFIKNSSYSFRGKPVIYVLGYQSDWSKPIESPVTLTADAPRSTFEVSVEEVSSFNTGDLVIVASDVTPGMIEACGMQGLWSDKLKGPRYCRIVRKIDSERKTITLDAPIRFEVKVRDNARIYKVGKHVRECGLEDFTIGNFEHPNIEYFVNLQKQPTSDDLDFMKKDKPQYELHATHFVIFRNALNCWMRNIDSYRPQENRFDVHFLSNVLSLKESRQVTIENCSFQKPQYRGGGGNGYMFTFEGSDCLIKNCEGYLARHNYSFKSMCTHGNVLLGCKSRDTRYSTDFHMHMSVANLIDGMQIEGDYIDARFRPWGGISGTMHGQVTSESVIWNAKGIKAHPDHNFLIDSRQFGMGYVVGTSGTMHKVVTEPAVGEEAKIKFNTLPLDFVEGEGKGEKLEPQSLYQDQLKRRLKGKR